MIKPVFVLDTNVFISAQLIDNSVSAKVFDKILEIGFIAISDALLNEYTEVLYRRKLDRYLSENKRQSIIEQVIKSALIFDPSIKINECRDHKDNIILELAVTCNATCIISGDSDLKVMHPFKSIPILSGAEFLATFK